MTLNISYKSEKEWHALRKKFIGASEVSALFGVNPYTTLFELWHIKAGNIEPLDVESERVKWGTRLESAIAKGIAKDQDWKIQKVHRYMVHPVVDGLGCSLDYEVINHPQGPGCLEIKNVSLDSWRDKWDGENEEAPLHIELQLQAQMAVTSRGWGALGVLLGGVESKVFIRERNERIIRAIETKVQEFWLAVLNGQEPAVFDAKDYEAVCRLYGRAVPGKVADLQSDMRAAVLCEIIQDCSQRGSNAEKEGKAAKAELLALIGDAEKAVVAGYTVDAKTINRAGYTVAPTSYRQVRIKKEG